MIDIKFIRENIDKVRLSLLKRMDSISFDEVLQWDDERKSIISKVENLNAEKNTKSIQISELKKQGEDVSELVDKMKQNGEYTKSLNYKLGDIENKIFNFLSVLPNIPDDDVVSGGKENNVILHQWGEKPQFDFQIKNHVDLCESLNLVDYKRGAKLSGNGFWIYKGIGAQLEWALINFFISEHIKDGYEFLMVPHMLNYECGFVAGQFPKFQDEDYWIDASPVNKAGKFMLPTAETALVNYHRDEILAEDDLPKKYFAYTPCFRREAGSARTEERGMIRGHQFNKVEMVHYAHPDHSNESFDELVGKAERLVQKLGLHYQLSKLAAKDCSTTMARTYDIEVWLPSMGIYKEVSSASNGNDYQARRGNIRFRDKDGVKRYVHTLNASGLATSRLVPAIIEQNQQSDGSVIIPDVLRGYMGIDIIKPSKKKI